MSLSMEGWQSLEPKVKTLWLAQAGIGSLFYGVFFVVGDVIVRLATDERWPLPPFVAGLLLFALSTALTFYIAAKKFEYWKYRLGEEDLAVGYGILWRTRRFISRARIQHVDITAGLIARKLDLCEMSVFVGGQMAAAATIPGLNPREAERLRSVLLDKPPVGAFSEAEAAAAPAAPPLPDEPAPPPASQPTAEFSPPPEPSDPMAPPRREAPEPEDMWRPPVEEPTAQVPPPIEPSDPEIPPHRRE